MIRYSVIIPQRDRGDEVRRQLPALSSALAQLGEPYEILVIDDGSAPETLRLLNKLLDECHALRVLRLNQPSGASVAISAGLRAARGEVLIATEPGECYPAEQIPEMVAWLRRADLVVGRRRRDGLAKLRERFARLPRWLILGLESHDPDCLFWVARREVLADVTLGAGMVRYLPALVARRGYRVCETYVEHEGDKQRLQDVPPNLGDLLAAWWHCRRWRDQSTYELGSGGIGQPALRVVGEEDVQGSGFRVQEVGIEGGRRKAEGGRQESGVKGQESGFRSQVSQAKRA